MRDLAPYLYPLLLAAFVLLNFVMQRIAKWQKRQGEQEDVTSQPAADEAEKTLEELKQRRERLRQQRAQQQRERQRRERREREQPPAIVTTSPAERIKRAPGPPEQELPLEVRLARARSSRPSDASALPRQRPRDHHAARVRAALADRRSLREAFVLMTVLGPCQAEASSRDHPSQR